MARRVIQTKKYQWIHISLIKGEDVAFLEKNFDFHPLDLKDCREGVQRPKLDIYRDYYFMIFHFPVYDPNIRRVSINSLNFFMGKSCLISITNDPDEFLEQYFLRVQKKISGRLDYDPIKDHAGYLLYRIIDILYRDKFRMLSSLGQHLEEVEEEVYSHKNKEATTNLASLRRNILTLRRLLEPQLKMLDRLVDAKSTFISPKLSVYYDDVDDYLENIWSTLENYRDTVDSLYDTNESFINQKTNEVIKILTVISVALLPLTLIASIYGMNVEGLPFAEHPIGLGVVFILMAAIIFGSIIFAKKNKII